MTEWIPESLGARLSLFDGIAVPVIAYRRRRDRLEQELAKQAGVVSQPNRTQADNAISGDSSNRLRLNVAPQTDA
jgi:hypothetical protein